MKKFLLIPLTVLASIGVTLLMLEILLTVFVDVTDPLQYDHIDGVGMCLKPGQTGAYLADSVGGGPPVRGRFRINNAGFNSWRDYDKTAAASTYRIAVVGDSFVEALQVDITKSFPAVLEQRLLDHGINAEVLSFGVSGFGTAQVLTLVQNLVLDYSPDFIVYLFVPNDVEDSSPWLGRDPWNPQFDLNEDGELVALSYQPYVMPLGKRILKRSSLVRYLYFQKHWAARLRGMTEVPQWQDPSDGPPVNDAERRAWIIVERLLVKIDDALEEAGVPWLIVWQADTDPTYSQDRRQRLEEIAARHGLPYFDPTPDFVRDFDGSGQVHHIVGDGHWNERGHDVAGTTLAEWSLAHLDLMGSATVDGTTGP